MRLHKLEITAFGPFAETAIVDFDALGADGLFLLHGRTGAGKTTVLDAIAFALYGTVPGARKDCKRFQSDHADATTQPKVTLEATIGGRRLRITRSPEFARPKRNGSGMRVINATATLTWLDRGGQNLTRINEIGDEVNRLVGMSADQFFQVVLLPQGEFARFLRAENDEREKLLERLFDTERFGTAEQWLAEQRRSSAAQLTGQVQAIDRLAAQICTAAGAAVPAVDPVPWAAELLDQARVRSVESTAEVQARQADSARLQAVLDDGRRVADLHRRRNVALATQERLRLDQARHDALAAELVAAERAEPVGDALAERHVAAAAVTTAEQRVAVAAAALGAVPDDLAAAVESWTSQIARLDDAITEARAAQRLRAELAESRNRLQELDAAAERIAAAIDGLPARIDQLTADHRVAGESSSAAGELRIERDRIADSATAAIELADQRGMLAVAEAALIRTRSAHADARERVLDLREARLHGMAAELAATLTDGEPCQVCGSIEHPAPATSAASTVTAEDEQQARADERHAAARVESATEAVASIEQSIATLVHRGGDTDRELLAQRLEAADAAWNAAIAAGKRAADLARSLDEARADETRLAGQAAEIATSRSATAERITGRTERLDTITTRVRALAGADTRPESRRAELRTLIERATALATAKVAADTAAQLATTAGRRAETLARKYGFDDVAAAAQAARSTRWCDDARSELAEVAAARAHAVAVLGDPDIAAAAELPEPDVGALELDATAAAHAYRDAVAAQTDSLRRATDLETLVTQLWAAADRLAPMQARHAELDGVADVVAGRGRNSRRMSLRSYVLAARLEEVAAAGSVRLGRMSGGRYEFVHSDASGPRGRRGGLGLDVRDDYTGAVRSAKTLSGGETFLASLALALGLADTVAAESGGLVLDTLFIDEGFGGLDNDALDSVMGVLDELRAGGRVVGIVSHVDEMRQRIPSRLHVIRGRTGSRLQAVLPGRSAGSAPGLAG